MARAGQGKGRWGGGEGWGRDRQTTGMSDEADGTKMDEVKKKKSTLSSHKLCQSMTKTPPGVCDRVRGG